MTNEKKREYIKKHWNVSSGKEIAKMCKAYFKSVGHGKRIEGAVDQKERKNKAAAAYIVGQYDTIKEAERIFGVKAEA